MNTEDKQSSLRHVFYESQRSQMLDDDNELIHHAIKP